MSAIQRYDLETTGEGDYAYCESMRKRADGDWVTYDDHAAALAAERQRIIDEMVTPLMEAIKGVTDAVTDAVRLCMFVATDADQWMNIRSEALRSQEALAAVSAKLKEIK